jgi:hypothetical protein
MTKSEAPIKQKISDNGTSNSRCEIQLPGCKNHDGRHDSLSITFRRSNQSASICASCLKKKLATSWTY